MKKPNVIALPTSQMMALCDVLGLAEGSTEEMIVTLETADFSKLSVVKPDPNIPRPPNTIGYELAEVEPEIVEARKAKLGRI